MNNFYYAQLDEENYVVGISQLSGEVNQENMIPIDYYDTSYLNRKYDVVNKVWTDEYRQDKPIEPAQTQLDRIESLLSKKEEDIIDNYTLSLINYGIII